MNNSSDSKRDKTCALTGAAGYVGRCLQMRLAQFGWQVTPWSRRPAAGGVRFELGEAVNAADLRHASALVHCAYDFRPRSWQEIKEVNVEGTRRLLAAAREAGVQNVVIISTISAFSGCRSLYGRAKLEIEAIARETGACIVRPGLVYGGEPGGMFGKLTATLARSRMVPFIYGGRQLQYLVHEEDLARVVAACLEGKTDAGGQPITVAHPEGISLRELLGRISRALERKHVFVPVPWRILWLALRTLEKAGVPTAFRSDSVISLVYQDPRPDFTALERLGIACRAFDPSVVRFVRSGA